MPRKQRVPAYGCHQATVQPVVRLDGRDKYLGKHGTPESPGQFQRLISEWRLQQVEREGQRRDATLEGTSVLRTILVEELIFRFRQFAKTYYVKDGRPSNLLVCMKDSLRPLRKLYGSLNGIEFGRLAMFKHSGCLDVMLTTDPTPAPNRSVPVPGDRRLLIAPIKCQTRALLYRVKIPSTKVPLAFSSPWRASPSTLLKT